MTVHKNHREMINPRNNRARNLALAAAGQVALGAAAAGGQRAREALNEIGRRGYNAVNRYFQGDVNQPKSSRTVQQVAVIRPGRGMRARARGVRNAGVTHPESGTLKIGDVATTATAADCASGKCIVSFPLQVETIGGRLFAMSKLYSRWRLDKAVLRYVPSVSSATDGGLVAYYTQEPDDTYTVGEAVGAQNAASAVDNMEFAVREKASIPLHLNPTLLYTTPSSSERTWHSAGVINVISNGSLTTSKTYGSLYLDFTATFSQPTAPFDVYAPLLYYSGIGSPAGTGSRGVASGPLFDFSADAALVAPESGKQWLIDPTTNAVPASGAVHSGDRKSVV